MRGHNEGTICQRKDGKWVGAVTLEGNKRKYFYGKRREDVAKAVNKALSDKQEGRPIVSERLTVAKFMAQWLETAEHNVRPSTFVSYEGYIRLHAVPSLGGLKLARLTPRHLQALYAYKLKEGLSAMSVKHLHAVIHRALSQALRWGLVATNVADAVDAPRAKRTEFQTLSPEQVRALFEAAQGDRFEALYSLALTTGMRQGELLGLRWRDVDLEGKSLQVVNTVQRAAKKLYFAEPKTDHSRRRVILTDTAIAALRRHRLAQVQERLSIGAAWEDHDLVFPNELGGLMDAGNLRRRSFWRILKKAGIPRLRFHDLRHSAATLLLSRGINAKVIQEMLGHSSISITLDIYSHVLPTMQREAVDVMDAVCRG